MSGGFFLCRTKILKCCQSYYISADNTCKGKLFCFLLILKKNRSLYLKRWFFVITFKYMNIDESWELKNHETELTTVNLYYLQNAHRDCMAQIVPTPALQEHLVDCACKTVKAVTTHVIQLLVVTVTRLWYHPMVIIARYMYMYKVVFLS